MSGAGAPPFRAEHIGSLLRPERLIAARRRCEAGEIGRDELAAIEDAAITNAVRLQQAVGLAVVTDGEFRRASYHGYFYRVLTRQGAEAPGGARDYIAGGHMTAGFALIAFPAKYGDSGVMTFVVNQAGIVFEKDLGPNTASVATAIVEFNPDATWKTR